MQARDYYNNEPIFVKHRKVNANDVNNLDATVETLHVTLIDIFDIETNQALVFKGANFKETCNTEF